MKFVLLQGDSMDAKWLKNLTQNYEEQKADQELHYFQRMELQKQQFEKIRKRLIKSHLAILKTLRFYKNELRKLGYESLLHYEDSAALEEGPHIPAVFSLHVGTKAGQGLPIEKDKADFVEFRTRDYNAIQVSLNKGTTSPVEYYLRPEDVDEELVDDLLHKFLFMVFRAE